MDAFVGRERELATLRGLADSGRFTMAVVYGRRRIGKTALLEEFCKGRRTLFFTATVALDVENLRNFTAVTLDFFGEELPWGSFPGWKEAFSYVARKAAEQQGDPFVFVFDEFPYAAAANPALPSILQNAIDHEFSSTMVTMILCGSNEGFMESEVLSYKAPLYGRRNAQIHLQPFTLTDAVRLMPSGTTWEDKVDYYAVLGGTPYYLREINPDKTFAENVASLFFNPDGILYGETHMLLREELRNPMTYLSVLNAIAAGNNTFKTIGDAVRKDRTAVAPYVNTLAGLGIVEREVPFGEDPVTSKKGLWHIRDPFFDYWFRFVSPAIPMIERGRGASLARAGSQGPAFETYVGARFEDMCMQWLLEPSVEGRLPFEPMRAGRWWGNDPAAKEQTDIDLVVDSPVERRLLLGECKWRNHVDETEAVERLKARRPLIKGRYDRCDYYLFTKLPVSGGTRRKALQDDTLHLVDAQAMVES